MTDVFSRTQDAIDAAQRVGKTNDVWVGLKTLRPCEESPPRFSTQDCKECPDHICETKERFRS